MSPPSTATPFCPVIDRIQCLCLLLEPTQPTACHPLYRSSVERVLSRAVVQALSNLATALFSCPGRWRLVVCGREAKDGCRVVSRRATLESSKPLALGLPKAAAEHERDDGCRRRLMTRKPAKAESRRATSAVRLELELTVTPPVSALALPVGLRDTEACCCRTPARRCPPANLLHPPTGAPRRKFFPSAGDAQARLCAEQYSF